MILFSKSWKSQSLTGSSTQLFSKYSSPRLSCAVANLPIPTLWFQLPLELQLVVLKLTVKAEVPATVCQSMSEILHSPVAKLNVADLDKHWEHKGWWAPSHALSEASIITSQQEATSASGWFSWVRFFGRLVRHWRRLECPVVAIVVRISPTSWAPTNGIGAWGQLDSVCSHWVLAWPKINSRASIFFLGLKLLSICWIICHGYLTLEEEKNIKKETILTGRQWVVLYVSSMLCCSSIRSVLDNVVAVFT